MDLCPIRLMLEDILAQTHCFRPVSCKSVWQFVACRPAKPESGGLCFGLTATAATLYGDQFAGLHIKLFVLVDLPFVEPTRAQSVCLAFAPQQPTARFFAFGTGTQVDHVVFLHQLSLAGPTSREF